jgi:hypothetical protein
MLIKEMSIRALEDELDLIENLRRGCEEKAKAVFDDLRAAVVIELQRRVRRQKRCAVIAAA